MLIKEETVNIVGGSFVRVALDPAQVPAARAVRARLVQEAVRYDDAGVALGTNATDITDRAVVEVYRKADGGEASVTVSPPSNLSGTLQVYVD